MKERTIVISGRHRTGLFYATLLGLSLCSLAASTAVPCVWNGVEKIVAVGDLHGEYDDFVTILKGTKVVDEELRWIGGKTHLVQLGDIMDRGASARKIFDLLMRLEKEATEAGGKVHVLIGNHEEMNITRYVFDFGNYVTPEQFESFLTDRFRRKKLAIFAKHVVGMDVGDIDTDLSRNDKLKTFWEGVLENETEGREAYFRGFMSLYGKWLLRQNVVIKINDVVFVHGGISPAVVSMGLEKINETLRYELGRLSHSLGRDDSDFIPRLVFRRDGPLWYRDMALGAEGKIKGDVEKILEKLAAKHIVIAHSYRPGSPVSMEFLTRLQGRVWAIDTGIFEHNVSALIIENGKFSVWGEKNDKQDAVRRNSYFPFVDWNP